METSFPVAIVRTSDNPTPARITITPMVEFDLVRLRVEIGSEVMDFDLTPSNYGLAVAGTPETPAHLIRRCLAR